MPVTLKLTHRWWPAVTFVLLFGTLGYAFLPYAGLQNDEVLFATPDYHQPSSSLFTIPIGRYHLPIMQLSYLGALKTWVYAPILFRIRPSFLTIRLPVLLLGAMTIGMFVWFLDRVHGKRAAWVGGALLATDTMFLLTSCFDWGPVVFQHLMLMAALALLLKFAISGNAPALFLGFCAFGLGMWDKALFSWMLGGVALAAVLVFPKELWSRLTGPNLARAVAGFCLGALPLIVYNASSGFATFRSNTSFTLSEMPIKVRALKSTWDGSALLTYFVSSPLLPGQPRDPDTAVERLSAGIHNAFGERGRNTMAWGAGLAVLLAVPLLWRSGARRILLFCLIASAVSWIQMALTKGAGGSSHHVVLLYPLPQCFLAVAFAEASQWAALRRWNLGGWLLAAGVVFLCAENLLLTNQYFYQFARYGAAGSWSTAIYKLSNEINRFKDVEFVVDDWGILNPLAVLHRGRQPLIFVNESFPTLGVDENNRIWQQRVMGEGIWLGHARAFQEFPETSALLEKYAGSQGFHKEILEVVQDRNARPVFEIFRFVKPAS